MRAVPHVTLLWRILLRQKTAVLKNGGVGYRANSLKRDGCEQAVNTLGQLYLGARSMSRSWSYPGCRKRPSRISRRIIQTTRIIPVVDHSPPQRAVTPHEMNRGSITKRLVWRNA